MLQGQLEASKEEKSELLRRVKKAKEVMKESQEKSAAVCVNFQIRPPTH